jgi:hypothetical protein
MIVDDLVGSWQWRKGTRRMLRFQRPMVRSFAHHALKKDHPGACKIHCSQLKDKSMIMTERIYHSATGALGV